MTLAFWSTVALLLAGALSFVLPPLLRPRSPSQAGPSPLAIYREQRAQFDAELVQGTLSPAQHAVALRELHSRVVTEVGEDPQAAVPLARRLPPFASIVAVALLVPGGALALYGLLGTPAALAPATVQAATTAAAAPHTMSRDEMQEMVERLAEKLAKSPDDAQGWHMLARSYSAFGRTAEAAQAYDRATQLAPGNPQMLADYADALAMNNGRNLEGRPLDLVNAALKIDPLHPKSLALAGTAAFNRGDFGLAIVSWKKLAATMPPQSEQALSLATSIAQAQAQAGAPRSEPTRAAAAPASVAADSAAIEGSVAIADALKPRLTAGMTLFVFARVVNGPRMPLAILRVPAGQFPFPFKLDDSSAMTPQFKLSGQPAAMLGARLSRSGNASPQSGDLMGTLGPVKPGSRGHQLVIDGVVP